MKPIKNILISWICPDYNRLIEVNEILLKDIRTITMSKSRDRADIIKAVYRMRFIAEDAIWFGEP